MSPSGGQSSSPAAGPPAGDGCPLPRSAQTRNLLIFAANWGLVYLAAPVTYVGFVQSALLSRLEFGPIAANVPLAVYLLTAPVAVLVVWWFPQVRLLRPLLVASFLATAAMGAVVVAADGVEAGLGGRGHVAHGELVVGPGVRLHRAPHVAGGLGLVPEPHHHVIERLGTVVRQPFVNVGRSAMFAGGIERLRYQA